MGVRIDWTWNEPEIDRMLRSPDGEVATYIRRIAEATRSLAVAKAPVDNGPLRASLRVRMEYSGTQVKAWVYSNLEYALYVHEGTGVYGPKGQPIRPKRAQYLRFEARNPRTTAPGRGNIVFARQVKGARPNRFLLEALRQAAPWPVDGTVIYTG